MPLSIGDEFPLLMREIKAFGTRRHFYAIRVAAPVLALPVLLLAGTSTAFTTNVRDVMEGFGRFIGEICLFCQYTIVVLGAPIWGANAISRERDQGTLPLLMLADMRGFDIILSKLAGAYGPVAFLLFAALPIIFIGTFIGAPVSVITAHMVSMLAIGFMATCGGLWIATWRVNAIQAASITIGAVMMYMAVITALQIPYPGWAAIAPYRTWHSLQFMFPHEALAYGLSAFAPLLLGGAMLPLAWRGIRKHAAPSPVAPSRRTRSRYLVLRPSVPARIMLRSAAGLMGEGSSLWMKIVIVVLVAFIGAVPYLGSMAIFVLVAYDVLTTHHRLRDTSALDDLLQTPLTDRELARAMFVSNLYRLWPVLPGLMTSQFISAGITSGGTFTSFGDWIMEWLLSAAITAPFAAIAQYVFIVALCCAISLYLGNTLGSLAVAVFLYGVLSIMIGSGTMVAYALVAVVVEIGGAVLNLPKGMVVPRAVALPLAYLGPALILKSLASWVFYRDFVSDFGKLVRFDAGRRAAPRPRERW